MKFLLLETELQRNTCCIPAVPNRFCFPSKSFFPLFHIPKLGLLGPSHWGSLVPIFWYTLANGKQQWEIREGGDTLCVMLPLLPPHELCWQLCWQWLLSGSKSLSNGVLVSKSCRNKVPQTGRLTTTDIYSLPALGARSPKSRCQQCHAPSEGCRREFFASSSFWWL